LLEAPVSGPVVIEERRGDIALISIDHPPVNALAHAVRSALLGAVIAADGDPKVRAMVIRGVGRHFVAGADIREFDQDPRAPLLNDVLKRIEASSKPVVAAMHGAALGGGLELALACHYRIASPGASFGLPEIRLGLLPGSGGTQRLPRLIGAAPALALMLSRDPIQCARAAELGIIDRLAEDSDVEAAALAYAREIAASGAAPRRLCERTVEGGAPDEASIARERSAAQRKFPGVKSVDAIVESVQAAASQPFDTGLALSRRRFEECRQSTESRALRHLFFAERDPRLGEEPRPVRAVGVLGAGTMGSGIAISLATAGYEVSLVDTDDRALAAGMERVRSTLAAAVEKGRLDAAAAAAATARVRPGGRIEALEGADLTIEAVFESLAVKKDVFAALGRICRPGAVLASNTSTLDIDAIAEGSQRPADVVGMHFFSPANIMRLVEIVRGAASAPEVIATAASVTRRMGKLGIVVGNCFGFVGNRMLYGYGRENQFLMLEGAAPAQIDAALEAFGMAMGPNAVGDLAGLDVGYRVRRERTDRPSDPRYYRVADLLVEAGRLGQKSARGAFTYAHGSRRPTRDAEVESMIAAEAKRLGVERRAIADQEIRERCLYALINEGAKLLAEGIAASPGDIDAIWCNGYGFPRFRGGPMFYADTVGCAAVLQGIGKLAETHGREYWTPARLLEEIAAAGETFQAWQNRRAATTGAS
jgi:3-hydroxyacyl-CoA dehydrogenase